MKPPKCWICMDIGLIFYSVKKGDNLCTYGARCKCVKGQNRREKAVPTVNNIRNGPNIYELAKQNRNSWINHNPNCYAPPIDNVWGTEVEFKQEEIPF